MSADAECALSVSDRTRNLAMATHSADISRHEKKNVRVAGSRKEATSRSMHVQVHNLIHI
jgi:hypothetical protein